MNYLKEYKRLGFKLTHIPIGEKGPTHTGWNTTATKYKSLSNGLGLEQGKCNVGLLHGLSKIVCFDIDDVKACDDIGDGTFMELMSSGMQYTSGKKNRIKVLFSVGKKMLPFCKTWTIKNNKGKVVGQFRCMSREGKSMQDVLPPSLHPEGTQYQWLSELSGFDKVPRLPKVFEKELIEMGEISENLNGRYNSEAVSEYVKAYNDFYASQGNDLESDVLAWGNYESVGMGRIRRIGSTGNLSAIITLDEYGGQIGQNFSDTEGDKLLAVGPFDPYSFLVQSKFKGDEAAARRYVCSENKETAAMVDKEVGTKELKIAENGIVFDEKTGCPSLSKDVMIPENSKFGELVESIMYHQIQVHNPNMAFWYSLVLVDYLAGGGYKSFMTATMSPLYCFTSGTSSDGKTRTIGSGETHLFSIGGGGDPDMSLEAAELAELMNKPDDMMTTEEKKQLTSPSFSTFFTNKRQVDDAGSVEGIKDLVGKTLGHGCDILYTHDEFGITTSGRDSQRNDSMKGFIMSAKSLDRLKPFRYRLKAQNKENKAGVDTYCVHFNYFTSTTNESLKGVLGQSDVGQGFMQRFIGGPSITELNSTRVEVYGKISPDNIDIKNKVKKNLHKIVKTSAACKGIDRTNGGVEIKMEAGVLEMINQKSVWIGEQTKLGNNENLKILENLLPVARVRAIIENPTNPVVTKEIFKWADTVVSSSVLFFKWLLGELKERPANENLTIERKVFHWLEKNADKLTYELAVAGKGLTRRELVRGSGLGQYGAAAYNEVLDALERAEEFTVVSSNTGSGRVKKLIVYSND